MVQKDDDGVINLRKNKDQDEAEFKIGHVEEDNSPNPEVVGKLNPVSDEEFGKATNQTYSKVMVKFEKFVNLVASHAYEEIFEKYREEDVIISTDLLTDLANAHEEKSDKKVPMMFIIGIALGGILMWLLLRT